MGMRNDRVFPLPVAAPTKRSVSSVEIGIEIEKHHMSILILEYDIQVAHVQQEEEECISEWEGVE